MDGESVGKGGRGGGEEREGEGDREGQEKGKGRRGEGKGGGEQGNREEGRGGRGVICHCTLHIPHCAVFGVYDYQFSPSTGSILALP